MKDAEIGEDNDASCDKPILVDKTNENNVVDETLKPRPGETLPNPLSKRQMKRNRKRELFELKKKRMKVKEKERLKRKRQEAVAQGLPATNGPTRKQLKKLAAVQKDDEESTKIAFDLNYDNEMNDSDTSKCLKQCLRIYSINRRSTKPCTLHFTGIKSEGRVHNSFKRNDGWENWNVTYHFDKTHDEVFPKDQMIYLTCESDDVLQELESNKIYIIGGLVDHNHYKGLCHERATKAGLKTARLPLSEHVDMKTRQILSTYHVFEILLRVSEGKSWTEAILQTLPLRKGAKPKGPVNKNLENTETIVPVEEAEINNSS